jgi:hypothetical protein
MDIHNGLNGNRAILVNRPDHSSISSMKGRPGYVQHPYNFHGQQFGRRTYSYQGHMYSRFYHGYGYHGQNLDVYAPGFFFPSPFYGWAYNRWRFRVALMAGSPAAIAVGVGGAPWAAYYAYYYQPDPNYPEAAAWLTDDIISTDLQAAYAAQQQAGEVDGAPPAANGPPILTPEIKQQIADEVRNQLALENQEAQQNAQGQASDPGSSGIPRMMSDGRPHVFVVGAPLDVTNSSQAECALSDGDVLQLQTAPAADATSATLTVLASKGGQECQQNDTVTVQLTDLQEMQNSMRATLDQGLQTLQTQQGQGGLPAAPATAQGQTAPAQYAAVAPPPDPNAGTEIQQQGQLANQAEQAVTTDASQGGAAPAAQPPPY